MYKIEDYQETYNKYFEIFRDTAPTQMVEWGGYQSGQPTGMASSLESIIAFANLVKNENGLILNAGAGASSWVLRKIFKNVICTDPLLDYLNVVQSICESHNVNSSGFIHKLRNVGQIDYTYYDYGGAEREPCLGLAVLRTNYKIYVDDTDDRIWCAPLREYTYTLAHEYGVDIKDCSDAIDKWGRWGTILTIRE